MPPSGGPKPKLTPVVHRAIVAAVRAGVPHKFAAEAAGVSESGLYKWLRQGRKGMTPETVKLVHAIKKARAAGIAARLKRITAAARKQWTADAWVLERTHPDHFGANQRELRDLKKALADVTDRLARMAPPPPAPDAPRPAPDTPPGLPPAGPAGDRPGVD